MNNKFQELLNTEIDRLQSIQESVHTNAVPSTWYKSNWSAKLIRDRGSSFSSLLMKLGRVITIILF